MKSIKINQIDLVGNNIINTFESIREAAKELKTSDTAIRYACFNSSTHIYKNYKWSTNE